MRATQGFHFQILDSHPKKPNSINFKTKISANKESKILLNFHKRKSYYIVFYNYFKVIELSSSFNINNVIMIIDHNSKNQLMIINTALFYICLTTLSASKQNIFWHENVEIIKCLQSQSPYFYPQSQAMITH